MLNQKTQIVNLSIQKWGENITRLRKLIFQHTPFNKGCWLAVFRYPFKVYKLSVRRFRFLPNLSDSLKSFLQPSVNLINTRNKRTEEIKTIPSDSQLLLADNKDILDDNETPTRTDYVKKREIDRSTLYIFDGPFQLLHAGVGSLELFRKNAKFIQYVLPLVGWYSPKAYVYSMISRKQILQKMKLFSDEVKGKRKGKRMRLQVDNQFQQV